MNFAIIVAGGSSNRMGADTPKQFMLLDGLPIMMHAISAFNQSESFPKIITVIHPSQRERWAALCKQHSFEIAQTVVAGGASRFESVKNGIAAIKSTGVDLADCLIAVHDAARPLVSPALVDQTYRQATHTGAAALAVPSTDSVRIKSSNGLKNSSYPRSFVYLMQTPQTFNGAILYDAYTQPEDPSFTDDTSVVEKKGYPITLLRGDTRNIKITFPVDLLIAAVLRKAP